MTIKPTLRLGEALRQGEYLQNEQGLTFIMQQDGNFVLYDNANNWTAEHMLWQSRTTNKGLFVQLETDGNLVIYDRHVTRVWESGTAHKSVNMLFLDGFIPQLVHASGSVADSTFKVDKVIYSFKADINLFPRPLNAGVVLIGSLLWQDDGNNGEKDLRKDWRLNTFESNSTGLHKMLVLFPIRYGRMSSGNVYTMVVSSELCQPGGSLNGFGHAVLLKVKFQLRSMQDVLQLAYSLAQAEGITCGAEVIRPKNKRLGWAFISYALNFKKQVDEQTKTALDKFWAPKASEIFIKTRKPYYQNFKVDSEKNSIINSSGRLIFLESYWLTGYGSDHFLMQELDILLTTVTQPRLKDKDYSRYPTYTELAENVWADKSRFYFCNNYMNSITTHQDKMTLYSRGDIFRDVYLKRGHYSATRYYFLYFNYLGQIQLLNPGGDGSPEYPRILWTSPSYADGEYLKLGDDFNLAVYDASGNQIWSAGIYYAKDIPKGYSYVSCEESALYVKDNVLVLSIGKRHIKADNGTDTRVIDGLKWTSSPLFDGDGKWENGFSIKRGEYAVFNGYAFYLSLEGELQILNERHVRVWFLNVHTKAENFCFDAVSKIFTLYDAGKQVIWSTKDTTASLKERGYYFNKVIYVSSRPLIVYQSILNGTSKFINPSFVFEKSTSLPFILWRAESAFFGKHELQFSNYGYACLHHPYGAIVWMSPVGVKGDRLEYQDDGNLVIYDGKDSKWSANVYAGKDSGHSSDKFTFKKYIEIADGVFKVAVTERSYIASDGPRVALRDLNWRALYFREQCDTPFELHKQEFMVIDDYKIEFNEKGRIFITKFHSEYSAVFCWESPKAGDSLKYQEDGNLVIYNGKNSVWSIDVYDDKDRSDILRMLNISDFKMVSSNHYLKIVDGFIEVGINNRRISYKLDGYDVVVGCSDMIRKADK